VASALRDHLSDGRSIRSFPRAALADPQLVLAVFLAPLGLFAYMAFLHVHMGDALAFSHIQRAWNRELGNPLIILLRGFMAKDLMQLLGGSMVQWCALWTSLALMLTTYMMWLRRFPEAIFALICILIPLSTSLDSMPRYVMGIAPLLIVASELIASRMSIMAAALPLLVAANIPLLVFWAKGAGFLI
jgi:hypothetical protein